MRNLSTESVLLALIPIIIITLGLIGSLLYLSANNIDPRSRASEPQNPLPVVSLTPTPNRTTSTIPTYKPESNTQETVCTELYNPVCGIDNKTYDNSCQADLANVAIAVQGPCKLTKSSR